MLIIGVALIVVFCFSIYGACHAPSWTVFKDLLCPMLVLLAGVGLLIYCVVLFQYTASEHRKNIINREYGTDYSQTEVFYASSVIETVRELDRKRVEINGDIVTGK